MKKTVLVLSVLIFLTAASFAQISVTLTGTNSTCQSPCSGTATALVDGGSGAYAYQWSNGSTDESIQNLCVGTYTVTVSDFRGCAADPSGANCSATATIDVTMTGGGQPLSCSVSSNIASNNTLYLGYGAQSATLTVTALGTAPFTYAWTPAGGLSCTSCASPVFTPTSPGLYTFSVRVTNGGSCASTSNCSITICVLDIQVPGNGKNNNDKKVYVCHLPPGNPANAQSICVSINAVSAHVGLHGGDYLGMCHQTCGSGKTDVTTPELMVDESGDGFDLLVYPNPFTNNFKIQPEVLSTSSYTVKIFDVTGAMVDMKQNLDPAQYVVMGQELSNGIYFAEILQGNNRRVIRMVKSE